MSASECGKRRRGGGLGDEVVEGGIVGGAGEGPGAVEQRDAESGQRVGNNAGDQRAGRLQAEGQRRGCREEQEEKERRRLSGVV